MHGHYRHGCNERYEEYEEDGYDDYEEDIEKDAYVAEENEEEPKHNKEELEFLKLREQLKEKHRQQLKKQSALAFGHSNQSQDRIRTSTNDNFGSFFGPSQPVIASRVLDESRAIRETQHITSKVSSSFSVRQGVSAFVSPERKSNELQRPIDNELRRKAQTLKDMRDYSFLFSDDTDLPDNEPPLASDHFLPKPVKSPLKSNGPVREPMNTVPTIQHMQTKVPMKGAKVSRTLPSSGHYVGGNGPGKPAGPKPLPKPMPSNVPQQSKVPGHVPLKSKVVGQVMGTKKPDAKALNRLSLQKNLSTSMPYHPTQNHYVVQKRASQGLDRIKTAPKPAPKLVPPLKTQPPKTISSRDICAEKHLKKPVKRPDEDDEAIQMIRKMFGYNPNKYAGMDDDDSDMEADFSQIQKEEWRSARIARKEDDEQLKLLEEEEKREMIRKKKKLNRR